MLCVLTLPHSFTQDGGGGGAGRPDSGDLQISAIISECAGNGFAAWKNWKGIPCEKVLREDETDFGILVFSNPEHFTRATPMDIPQPILDINLSDIHALSCINSFNLAKMMLVKDGETYRATDETILDTIRANDIHTEMMEYLQKAITRSCKNAELRSLRKLGRTKATSRASKGGTVKYKDCDPIPKEHISAELYLNVIQEKRRRIGVLTPVEYLQSGEGPIGAVEYVEVESGSPSGSGQGAAGRVNAKMVVDDEPEDVKVDEGGVGSAPPTKKRRFGEPSPKVDATVTADLARQMKRMASPLGGIHLFHAARVAQETSDVAHEAMAIADEATGSGKSVRAC